MSFPRQTDMVWTRHVDQHVTPFTPALVPEVAAGYWWDAANTSGLGTSAFRVIEGNGHSGSDLLQATVLNQPTVLTENGGTQFRLRKAADAHPSTLISAAFAAGWTGATYSGSWLRLPDNAGVPTGTNNLLLHGGTLARFGSLVSAASGLRTNISTDGTTIVNTRAASPFAGAGWHWIESVFDPLLVLGGSTSADFVKHFSDLVLLTPTVTASNPSTLANPTEAARLNASTGGGANADNVDWVFSTESNGIPSLSDRVRIANFRNPTGIPLT